ncbi:M56 family metallopeptidase [Flavobacterium sp. 5]|uniref:M56 family metallopeptidase n=1 Tax=Flavobacterium sp. 5 TaxID=2035199 RepID=UPI000C2C3642|nr:M56 family metallopeptidase [Flavobacterium sp. 5]PKB18399.1 BlaR1 peptidase M56 [Flavobacterium sp. 5]
METLFIYIAKSSGLITMFFLAYYLLLRKETFFTTNRWFLLAGLFTSVILPWIVFTTIVWVEPIQNSLDWSKIPTTPIQKDSFEINWYLVLASAYAIGTVLFLMQFAFDFYHLNRVLKGKQIKQQADHKFIDLQENIAPFSYFNTIVYNSSLYNESEMESILEHEKVHSEQYHTIDVLITRVFCILFWFNPFIWLYKNAILQNLEFIADSEASKNISDKKAYQLTLLKITTHENCVVLTNHFYQSLIKKRIVMLNKNQSKKWNFFKYALIIPALVAFVFLFQMEVIAKEKNQTLSTEKSNLISKTEDVNIYKINKNSTENDLKETASTINKNYGIEVRFTNTKRNSSNELTAITVEIKKGKELSEKRTTKSSEAIKTFAIVINKDSDGKLTIDFMDDNKMDKKEIANISENSPNIRIDDETQIFIDGEQSDKTEMDKLDSKEIVRVDVTNNNDEKEIRIITKNGEYRFNDKNMPVAPTPPTPPVFKNPKAPIFPKAPTPPKGDPVNGDKKAWKDFEKKMEDYDAKMEKLQPQIEAFDKQMAEFDKQMEPFNKQMEEFDKKMEVYEKQMKEYQPNPEN